jgi:hypothetical protein
MSYTLVMRYRRQNDRVMTHQRCATFEEKEMCLSCRLSLKRWACGETCDFHLFARLLTLALVVTFHVSIVHCYYNLLLCLRLSGLSLFP